MHPASVGGSGLPNIRLLAHAIQRAERTSPTDERFTTRTEGRHPGPRSRVRFSDDSDRCQPHLSVQQRARRHGIPGIHGTDGNVESATYRF